MRILFLTTVVILVCPLVIADWGYSQVDDLVLEFNEKNSDDVILHKNIIKTLKDKPRKYNDTQCIEQFQRVFVGAKKREIWALKVLDSWGKLPTSGFFWGRTVDMGHYDECLRIAHDLGGGGTGDDNIFVGQFCLASYPLEFVLQRETVKQKNALADERQESVYQRGVCVPDACSIETLDAIFKEMVRMKTNANITVPMFRPDECTRNENAEFETGEICAIIIFSLLGLIVACSTGYDILYGYLNRKKNPIFVCFSLTTNGKRLFKIKNESESSSTIGCLNGLRFISIIWIIYGHIFTMLPYVPIMNYSYIWEWTKEVYPLFILSGPFAVDTFFLLSGFLLAHHLLRHMEKRGGLNITTILWMYFHRYLRLFPVLGATILFTSTLFKRMGDGPYWKKVGMKAGRNCDEYWWSSLLYIQNIVNPSKLCMIHTWYLSADTQLYIIAPLIFIPLYKWGRKFVTIMIIMVVASTAFIFAIIMIKEIKINPLETLLAGAIDTKTLLYYNIHSRSPPWIIGILLAYFLYNQNEFSFPMSTVRKFGGWISFTVLLVGIIFAPYGQSPLDEPNFLANAIYGSLGRIVWSLIVAWLIFACHQGYGGFVNSFLSYPFWQVLARLTYTAYLIHPIVQYWIIGKQRLAVLYTHVASCLTHSWYLSIDMQFFILTPLILIPLYKWPKKSIGVILVIISASAAYCFGYILKHEIQIMNAMDTTLKTSNPIFFNFYQGIFPRSSVYLIGVLLAYGMNRFDKAQYQLAQIWVIVGWLLTAIIIPAIIFIPNDSIEQKRLDVDYVGQALYGGLSRPFWGLVVAWIIFACCQGYGGLVDSFLSYPMFEVFGRLTYSMYLCHVPIQIALNATTRSGGLVGTFVTIQQFWSEFGIVITISLFVALTLEYPVSSLEKVLFGKMKAEREANRPITNTYGNNMLVLQTRENRIDTTD